MPGPVTASLVGGSTMTMSWPVSRFLLSAQPSAVACVWSFAFKYAMNLVARVLASPRRGVAVEGAVGVGAGPGPALDSDGLGGSGAADGWVGPLASLLLERV